MNNDEYRLANIRQALKVQNQRVRPCEWYYTPDIMDADWDAEIHGPNLVTVRKSQLSDAWLVEIW